MSTNRYRIVRFYAYKESRTLRRGLTLEEAQAHCRDPETSSRTCRKPKNVWETRRHGPWFDGYTEDK